LLNANRDLSDPGMTYTSSYAAPSSPRYQPSLLELAREGNARAISHWLNSILAPQGMMVQAELGQSGRLTLMVNFHTQDSQACMEARKPLVRHICYRLWTLNSPTIRDIVVLGRLAGHRAVLWRQSVRIRTPANVRAQMDLLQTRPQAESGQEWFHLVRSLLLNRFALMGFVFFYWVLYLYMTGHQKAEAPNNDAKPQQEIVQDNGLGALGQPANAQTPANSGNAQTGQVLLSAVPPQFQGQVISEATPPPGAEKVVALTFDDGPWENYTEQVLAILQQNNIKATFYMVGEAIQANPAIAKKVVDEGHAVGNHTWRHIMDDMDQMTAITELSNNAKLIYQATGARTYLMRPPGGNQGGELVNYAKQRGYMVTMWSADSHDYMVSAPLIIDNVLSQTKPGGIVLLHDGGGNRAPTVEALPQIISSLRSQGYKFVTVPELMQLQAQWAKTQPTAAKPSSDLAIARLPQTFHAPPQTSQGASQEMPFQAH
jgi:peptidoglycan/xylan/chitin deacetylase (PgdA/CDA1 family)